jgi:anti-sigma B factor antagonist
MEVFVEKIDDVVVAVVLDGELNSSNSPEFKRGVTPVLEASTKLVIDLSRLRFVDSSGIGVLLFCLQQMTAKKGNLKLCGLSKRVREVVELVRMNRIIDIAGSKDEAVHAFCQLPE